MDYEYMCTGCLGNKSLIQYVKKNESKKISKCPICRSKNRPAIEITVLANYMNTCINHNYSKLEDRNGIDYNEETGSFYYIDTNDEVECTNICSICEENDVLSARINWSDHQELYEYMFEQAYPKKNIYEDLAESGWSHMSTNDLEFSWERFNYLIQNNNRFFDSCRRFRMEYLDKIFGLMSVFEQTIPIGTALYRVRKDCKLDASIFDSDITLLKEIAPPPCNCTKSYRMSPQGISYTYLSTDEITCLKECKSKCHDKVLIGEFCTKVELRILNLEIKEFETYDLFSGNLDREKENLREFIERYCNEISKSIEINSDLEYLSTQIIAEYIRFKGYDGIAYSSSKTKETNYVLFYGPDYYMFPDIKPSGWSIFADAVPSFTKVLELKEAKLCEVVNARSCRYVVIKERE